VRTSRKLAAATATALTATAMTVAVAATPAQAASPCWEAGFTSGGFQYIAYDCNTVYGARVYESQWSTRYIDHVYTSPQWYQCRTEGRDNGEGAPHPTRWLRVKGSQYGLWGYVRDTDIYNETNPLDPC
jgi:hypothetical protein